jgi:hypothetical protein
MWFHYWDIDFWARGKAPLTEPGGSERTEVALGLTQGSTGRFGHQHVKCKDRRPGCDFRARQVWKSVTWRVNSKW